MNNFWYGVSFIEIAMMVSEIQFLVTMPKNVRGRWFSTLKKNKDKMIISVNKAYFSHYQST